MITYIIKDSIYFKKKYKQIKRWNRNWRWYYISRYTGRAVIIFDSYDANIDFTNKDTKSVIESVSIKKWWNWENILLRI